MCNCEDITLKYAFMDSCLDVCPVDTYVYQYRDGSFACLKCSSVLNVRLNADRTGCDCNAGYEMNSDTSRCVIESSTQSGGLLIVD